MQYALFNAPNSPYVHVVPMWVHTISERSHTCTHLINHTFPHHLGEMDYHLGRNHHIHVVTMLSCFHGDVCTCAGHATPIESLR